MTKSEIVEDFSKHMSKNFWNKKTADGLCVLLEKRTIEQLSKISPKLLNEELRKLDIHLGIIDDYRGYYYYINNLIDSIKEYLKDLKIRIAKWELYIKDVLRTIQNQDRCTFGLIWELVDRDDGKYLLKQTLSFILEILLNRNFIIKKAGIGRTIYELTTSGVELLKSNKDIVIQLATEI